jgi:hypothetical protein
MLGLDAAGKTTILYKLHIGEILSTVPTVGMIHGIHFEHMYLQLSAAEVVLGHVPALSKHA